MINKLSPLREWLSRHATSEMRDNEVCISIDAVDDEIEELKSILKGDTEKYSVKFLGALEELGIAVCRECRSVKFEPKCKC